jgi:hypothetical protein
MLQLVNFGVTAATAIEASALARMFTRICHSKSGFTEPTCGAHLDAEQSRFSAELFGKAMIFHKQAYDSASENQFIIKVVNWRNLGTSATPVVMHFPNENTLAQTYPKPSESRQIIHWFNYFDEDQRRQLSAVSGLRSLLQHVPTAVSFVCRGDLQLSTELLKKEVAIYG